MTEAIEQRPYDGLRVIDLTRELGAYATRLFADLGAEVIRVEAPGGSPDRGKPAAPGLGGDVRFAFLNANKKSVALEAGTEAGRAVLAELVATAQVVVAEGAEASALLPLLLSVPGARVVTVVSHFGLDGPYAGYLGSDLVTQSLGGITWLSGEPDAPPLRLGGGQSGFVASLYAATATALALHDIEANGGGSHLLDVSAQECIASISDLPLDPQLVFRRFFRDVPHPSLGRPLRFPGAPFRLSEPVWRIDRPAPARPGEHDEELLRRAGPAAPRTAAG
jgi:benzylsuccinate CoA-transferase BbsE subunit